MKVEKKKFDTLLDRLIKAKPEPRKNIKVSEKKPAKVIVPPR